MAVETHAIYGLVVPGTDALLIEADTLDAFLLKVATLRETDPDLINESVVKKAGAYDGATTALIQENLV